MMIARLRMMLLLWSLAAAAGVSAGQPPAGGAALEGELGGAPYKIVVPRNWNGTLLIYAHGYRDRASHPGETEDRAVRLAPSAGEAPQLPAV